MPIIGLGINVCLEGVLLVLTFASIFNRGFSVYRAWCLIMLVFWAYTTTYSVTNDAFEAYWKLSLSYVVTFALSAQISSFSDVEKFIRIELVAITLCGFYVLMFVNMGNLKEERLGGNTEVWNANDIGLKMMMGYAISLYYVMKRNHGKLLYYVLIGLFLLVGLLSGSRKVIISLILFTSLIMIVKSRGKKKILYSMYAVVFSVGVYFAVMTIPVLYDIVGHRIDLMFEGLSGDDGGYSMTERSMMIAYGMEWFAEKPLWGHGYVGFSSLFENATGWFTYSHNNFVELLVNTGIIGFVLYYSITIYIIMKLWKPALREGNLLAIVLFVYTIVSTLLDYAMVSYVSIPTIYRIMYTTMLCQILTKQNVLAK